MFAFFGLCEFSDGMCKYPEVPLLCKSGSKYVFLQGSQSYVPNKQEVENYKRSFDRVVGEYPDISKDVLSMYLSLYMEIRYGENIRGITAEQITATLNYLELTSCLIE